MTDDEVPPPYSERELDQKISQALVISAQQPQIPQQPSDDGEWERWDDAVFALAEARNTGISSDLGSSSTNPSSRMQERQHVPHAPLPVPSAVQPLRVHKRANSKSSASAGWTGVNRDGPSSPGSSSSGHGHWHTPQSRHEIPLSSDEEDDRSVPPPPFASVGRRMDGIVRLEYHPESTPPSPLNSPLSEHHLSFPAPSVTTGQIHPPLSTLSAPTQAFPRSVTPQRSPRQSLPAPARSPNYHLEQRPLSTFHPRQGAISSQVVYTNSLPHTPEGFRQSVPSISSFQPSSQIPSPSVYNKTGQTLPVSQPPSFAAGAFYNSSVSAHLSSPLSMQPRESHSSRQHRTAQSVYHTPQNDHSFSHAPQVSASSSSLTDWSTLRRTIPSQNPTNVSRFPQYPAYSTQQAPPSTAQGWATSEQHLNRNPY